MQSLPPSHTKVVGITGPPGAGKSTLTDALINELSTKGKKVAVLCIDPSSPFNSGALLGDRIRMNEWFNSPNVFIRSLATRGALGGLHPKTIEITDIVKAAGFDMVIVETVGVGQSEIEIAGLADVTVVVLVPESGDDIQSMKSGLMEIGGIFAVNKADRPGADNFIRNLQLMASPTFRNSKDEPTIIKTIATAKRGITELMEAIEKRMDINNSGDTRFYLLAEKAYQLIRNEKMKGVDKGALYEKIKMENVSNIYAFVAALPK